MYAIMGAAVLAAGTAALLLGDAPKPPALAPFLKSGQLYRLTLTLPPAHVEAVRAAHGEQGQKALLADVEQRMEASGLVRGTLAVLQDPTDRSLFQVLAYARDPSALSPFPVVEATPIEVPPLAGVSHPGVLDAGLAADELSAVGRALASDTNPRHLYGFASTFAPFFPVAFSFLRAKGHLLEGLALRNAKDLDLLNQKAVDRARAAGKGSSDLVTPLPPLGPVVAKHFQLASRGRFPDAERAFAAIPAPASVWAFRDTLSRALGKDMPSHDVAKALRALDAQYPPDVVRDDLRRAIVDVVQKGESDALPPLGDIAAHVPIEVGRGICLVMPAAVNEVLPPQGDEGFVSPSALQLALAMAKPDVAHVARAERLPHILRQLASGQGASQAMRAQNQLQRAQRALERRRWVEWYRKVEG